MNERFDIEQVICILGLEARAEQADDGRDFDVACRIALEKLRKCKEYEDLEEKGLLLRLPCKVGDTVYYIEDNAICEFIVYSFDIRPLQEFVCNYGGIRFNLKNFGKSIFLAKEEAERKLKEMN